MKRILFLLFPLSAMATEAPLQPPKPAQFTASERNDLYGENGMDYAKDLYLKLDGTPEDDLRNRKSEALNSRVRERGIEKLEKHLAKNKDLRIRRELLHRLSQMHEQQAEITSRRADVKNKEMVIQASLRNSNKYLELLRKEFPAFSPDAVLFNLAENHSKLKENERAERYYREVISRFPKSSVVADSLLSLGNLYFERQGFQVARSFFQRILETTEVNLYPYAHYKMAWCYFNESNFPSAVARLEQSIYDSRKLQANGEKKLGVEEEALSDLVLFFAEYGNPDEAKAYFEKLVTKQKANELRYNLSQRLFDHGKHLLARNVAKQLLAEEPQKEYVNRLYLILISVAERLKDRDSGLETEQKLSTWIKGEKLAKEDTSRLETEEYMRQYTQKLHYEAETMKQTEVWAQAKKSYEIYLETFPDEADTADVKFRYAVLLMNRKEQLKAYQSVSEALAKMDNKHARYKEALRLKIQSVELAKADERKKMPDADLMATYDAYATNFSSEDLGVEAAYKAAGLAKNLETPELVAARFRAIAQNFPKHALAKSALTEALAVLVKAEKWEALRSESKMMAEKSEIQSGLLDKDDDLKKKIAEASELSQVKIAEGLEAQGKPEEAKAHYERILSEKPSQTLGVYSLVRLAALDEQKFHQNRDAIKHYEELRERYPSAKESRQAALELARLYDKVNEPLEAVARYQAFAGTGTGKTELQALTNVAVILESLGEREQAAEAFYRLHETMRAAKAPEKDQLSALEAGCNNSLLASHQNRERKTMQRILDCAKKLTAANSQALVWQARAAWALDQMADGLQAEESWKKLAARNLKATPEAERAYVAMGKVKLLGHSLEDFKKLKFSKTNERPEANIGNKTKALEEFEKLAENVIKVGTPKQIGQARNMLRLAYLDFAETMETAAVPSKLSDAEKEELKKSFVTFAKDFHDRANALEGTPESRNLASAAPAPELKIGSLSSSDERLLKSGEVPSDRAVEIFAKKAYDSYKNGRFGEARYFGEKWKRQLASSSAPAEYGSPELDRFQAVLAEKLPEVDPLTRDLF
ncbi:MAG: tetratricopeptide repeat protein [Bacteriovoracia bacterium]